MREKEESQIERARGKIKTGEDCQSLDISSKEKRIMKETNILRPDIKKSFISKKTIDLDFSLSLSLLGASASSHSSSSSSCATTCF
jgi:hypothetical protein